MYILNFVILSLHERAALGPALSHGWGLVHLLSPTGQRWQGKLRDSLQASAGTAALQLRPPHRRHRGDVENVPNAVLRDLGGALYVGHRPDLSSDCGALEHDDSRRTVSRLENYVFNRHETRKSLFSAEICDCEVHLDFSLEVCGSECASRQINKVDPPPRVCGTLT